MQTSIRVQNIKSLQNVKNVFINFIKLESRRDLALWCVFWFNMSRKLMKYGIFYFYFFLTLLIHILMHKYTFFPPVITVKTCCSIPNVILELRQTIFVENTFEISNYVHTFIEAIHQIISKNHWDKKYIVWNFEFLLGKDILPIYN